MEWLHALDWAILKIVAPGADSPGAVLLSKATRLLLDVHLIKMGPLVLMLLYVWFRSGGRPERGVLIDAELLMRGTVGITAALGVARLLQRTLPPRPRPRFVQSDIFPPLDELMRDMSSLPSDHAVLVGAVVTAIWAQSRPLGLLSAIWGALFVCLPRVYSGLHYVSDILAGAALGTAMTMVVLRVPLPVAAWDWLRRLSTHVPALIILGVFIFSWEVLEVFETARRLVAAVGKAARIISGEVS